MSDSSDMYQLYLNAEKKILLGQSVRFGERLLTRADLAEVRKGRIEWERKLQGRSSSKVRFV